MKQKDGSNTKSSDFTPEVKATEVMLNDLLTPDAVSQIRHLRGKLRWEGNLNELRQSRTFCQVLK